MTLREQMIADASSPYVFADVTAMQETIEYTPYGGETVTIIATVNRREDYAVTQGPNGPTQSRKYRLHVATVDVPNLVQGVNATDGDVFVIDGLRWKVYERPAHDVAMTIISVVNQNDTEISAPGARIKY